MGIDYRISVCQIMSVHLPPRHELSPTMGSSTLAIIKIIKPYKTYASTAYPCLQAVGDLIGLKMASFNIEIQKPDGKFSITWIGDQVTWTPEGLDMAKCKQYHWKHPTVPTTEVWIHLSKYVGPWQSVPCRIGIKSEGMAQAQHDQVD